MRPPHNVGGGNVRSGSVGGIVRSKGLVTAAAVMAMATVMMMATADSDCDGERHRHHH